MSAQSAIVTFGFAKMSLVLLEMESVEPFHPVWAVNQAESRNGGCRKQNIDEGAHCEDSVRTDGGDVVQG